MLTDFGLETAGFWSFHPKEMAPLSHNRLWHPEAIACGCSPGVEVLYVLRTPADEVHAEFWAEF